MVWSITTYGSEGWTIHKNEEKYNTEAFEMWFCRRLLRVEYRGQNTEQMNGY